LHDLGIYLCDYSMQVSGGESASLSDLRKARRIAKRGLDIVADTQIAIAPDLHADLWLAMGQSTARPANLRLNEAIASYTKALELKRQALNYDDVERLVRLLQQMFEYASKQTK